MTYENVNLLIKIKTVHILRWSIWHVHHSTSDSDDLPSSPYRCRTYVILLIILAKRGKGQSLPPAYPHVRYDDASGHFN